MTKTITPPAQMSAPSSDPLAAAAQDLLDAFGGDTPDWLRPEAEALANAIDSHNATMKAWNAALDTPEGQSAITDAVLSVYIAPAPVGIPLSEARIALLQAGRILTELRKEAGNVPHGLELNAPHFLNGIMEALSLVVTVVDNDVRSRDGASK